MLLIVVPDSFAALPMYMKSPFFVSVPDDTADYLRDLALSDSLRLHQPAVPLPWR
ncbi:hypothetical protein D3C73_1544150 [compost metagenome]